MNWTKGGTKTSRGGLFKATLAHVSHDKNGYTVNRVGEIEMLNLPANEPGQAWREMQASAEAATALKARNGTRPSARNQRPVCSISLSWHPDDKPHPKHMMDEARKVIELLAMSQHQARIVEHTVRPHKHVHSVVNLIHPETGKTASLSYDARKLDRWAHDYEASRNVIRIFGRTGKLQEREKPKVKESTKTSAKAHESPHILLTRI